MSVGAQQLRQRSAPPPKIVLSSEEKAVLKKLASGRSCSVRLAQRSSIVLLAANGLENLEIAEKLGIDRGAVSRWRRLYFSAGLEGIAYYELNYYFTAPKDMRFRLRPPSSRPMRLSLGSARYRIPAHFRFQPPFGRARTIT